MKLPKLTIIILNYNNFSDTFECLTSLQTNKYPRLRIVVVDNASTDDSLMKLKQKFNTVEFLESSRNLGFASGNNLGFQKYLKRTDCFLLLNNDTVITDPKFLEKLVLTKGDIVGTVVEYGNNPKLYDFGGIIDNQFGRNHHHISTTNTPPGKSKADYYSGVCLLIRTPVLSAIGLLDPKYFFYYEDADFCLRAKERGFKLGFCPTTKVTHKLSSSANKLGKTKLRWLINSHLQFCRQHLPWYSLPLALSFNLYLRIKLLL